MRLGILLFTALATGSAAQAQIAFVADTLHALPPALPGPTADPHLAAFGNTYYLYPTTDGLAGWGATSFSAWSSKDLKTWKNEGVILDLPRDLTWAAKNAWAPAIATKNGKYYFYYSAAQCVGVAVADRPTGPFKDPLGRPLVAKGQFKGQAIDPMVLVDDDGAAYLYWGQGQCHVVKLNADMTSYDPAAVVEFKPPGYNEGSFVFKRQGKYYLMWSEYDTRDPRYSVAYATASSPLGPWVKAAQNPVLKGRGVVQGAGHHSVLQVPGTDQWVIAYHRFIISGGNGYNRETCLSPMRFDAQGNILPVDVFEPVQATKIQAAKPIRRR
jgi:beta-xylosidase